MMEKTQFDMRDFLNFKPILSKEAREISFAEIRVTKNSIKFNRAAVSELHYPEYVMFLISDDAKRFVVVPKDKPDDYSMPFYDETKAMNRKQGEKRQQPLYIVHTDQSLVKSVRAKLKWDDNLIRICGGVRYREKDILFFDLTHTEFAKGRKTRRKVTADLLDSLPSLSELLIDMHPVPALPASQKGETTPEITVLEKDDLEAIAI